MNVSQDNTGMCILINSTESLKSRESRPKNGDPSIPMMSTTVKVMVWGCVTITMG